MLELKSRVLVVIRVQKLLKQLSLVVFGAGMMMSGAANTQQ